MVGHADTHELIEPATTSMSGERCRSVGVPIGQANMYIFMSNSHENKPRSQTDAIKRGDGRSPPPSASNDVKATGRSTLSTLSTTVIVWMRTCMLKVQDVAWRR